MSTVRKGFVTKGAEQCDGIAFTSRKYDGDVAAVLIVSSDGQPPRYFTQEEVKAMLEEMLEGPLMSSQITDGTMRVHDVQSIQPYTIKSIAAKHGITDL